MKKDAWVDLHLHTNFSDGLFSPTQLILKAKEMGLSAVGIVDHDTIDGIPEAMDAGSRISVEVVPGVELSSQFGNKDIHVIGYYFDPECSRLMEYLDLFLKERYRRAVKMVGNLNRLGIRMTMDEVEEKAKGKSIGRPHLAEVLMEKGYVETFQEAFQQYIGYGSESYEKKYKLLPEEAVGLISEAKGLSFLAHPGFSITDEILLNLVKAGLDGIEVVHPKLNPDRTQYLQKIAKRYGLLVCGGSDCHGGRDKYPTIGHYSVPYAILEEIKKELRTKCGDDSITLRGRIFAEKRSQNPRDQTSRHR